MRKLPEWVCIYLAITPKSTAGLRPHPLQPLRREGPIRASERKGIWIGVLTIVDPEAADRAFKAVEYVLERSLVLLQVGGSC